MWSFYKKNENFLTVRVGIGIYKKVQGLQFSNKRSRDQVATYEYVK